jgi:hypothetical protein
MQLIENGSDTLDFATSGLGDLASNRTARVLDLSSLPQILHPPTEHVHELIRAENCVAQ